MRFINYLFVILFVFSCTGRRNVKDLSQMYPPYKLISLYSSKIKRDTDLTLYGYGINIDVPKEYQYKNGIANFLASYYLYKSQKDNISLNEARNLIVFVVENFLKEINADQEIIPDLDFFPFTFDHLDISIHIVDKNKIDLGQGVASVHFWDGKIKYSGFNIEEYREVYPARGKHYTILEESYVEALDVVKKNGSLKNLQ